MKLSKTIVYLTLVTTTAILAESPAEINPPFPDTTPTVCVEQETFIATEESSKFDKKQAKILARIEKKQAKIEQYNDCILASDSISELKSCKK